VPTGINDGPFVASTVPAYLHSPRPNPFESVTEIEFMLESSGRADVSVYDVGGRRVARLASGEYPAGAQQLTWDGRGDDGRQLSSGVYFVKLQIPGHTSVKKVLLTK
jgi:flagellar hook assembly protein FlgD